MKTRRKNKKKKNKTRKQFGGTMGTYVPSKEDNPFVDNIVRNMVSYIFSETESRLSGIWELYLYGYDDFIGEHKLIPLYFHGGGKLQLNLLNVELKLNVLSVGHGGGYDFDDHSESVTD